MKNQINIIGIEKFVCNDILEEVKRFLATNTTGSKVIFACDARTLYMHSKGSQYICLPYKMASHILLDGRPVYWLASLALPQSVAHYSGPKFMEVVLRDQKLKKMRHMFYGGSELTVTALRKKCEEENVNIIYAESPAFLPIEDLEIERVTCLLNEFKPDFFWCGLGAPKQEYLISKLEYTQRVVMTGVGLGFDYYGGTVQTAPKILSELGLEWLFRYAQQPRRIRRFIKPFFYMIFELIKSIFIKALLRDERSHN